MIKIEETNSEYVYLTIPKEWMGIYHRLLTGLADFGKTIICCNNCKNKNNTIINCWNMFQSALASRALNDLESANKIIDYLNNTLEYIYKINNEDIYDKSVILPIENDGMLKAVVTYDNNYPKFKINPLTGILYEEWDGYKEDNKIFKIEDNSLIVEK